MDKYYSSLPTSHDTAAGMLSCSMMMYPDRSILTNWTSRQLLKSQGLDRNCALFSLPTVFIAEYKVCDIEGIHCSYSRVLVPKGSNDYHPVALTSSVMKGFEHIVKRSLLAMITQAIRHVHTCVYFSSSFSCVQSTGSPRGFIPNVITLMIARVH